MSFNGKNIKKAALHEARGKTGSVHFRQREKPVPIPETRKEAHVVGVQRFHEMKDRGR